jgi:hypothetical protein
MHYSHLTFPPEDKRIHAPLLPGRPPLYISSQNRYCSHAPTVNSVLKVTTSYLTNDNRSDFSFYFLSSIYCPNNDVIS